MKSTQTAKYIRYAKWFIALVSLCYLIVSFYVKFNHLNFTFIKQISIGTLFLNILPLFILMGLNWFIESYKWKLALKNIQSISIASAIKSVLSGISTGIFTPNRVGEFIGKIYFLEKKNRIKGISINIIVSFSQLLITLLVGCITYFSWNEIFFIPLLVATYLSLLYSPKIINFFLKHFKKLEKYIIPTFTTTQISVLYFLSLLRYFTFCIQYYFALNLFGLNLGLIQSIKLISSYFLYLAAIPTFAWSEIGVRGAIAVKLFEPFSNNPIQVITASSLIWLVNIACPALLGLFFIIKENDTN